MPTGYTAAIEDGRVTEFKDFAMLCARAMGACIMMRDEPLDAPIPEEFEPNVTYHTKAIKDAKSTIRHLQNAAREDLFDEHRVAAADIEKENARRLREHDAKTASYEKIETDAEAWEPPTNEHQGLKDFMLEQIRISKGYGPYLSDPLSPLDEWREGLIKEATEKIEYHTTKIEEEKTRTNERNQWLKDLRSSLQT